MRRIITFAKAEEECYGYRYTLNDDARRKGMATLRAMGLVLAVVLLIGCASQMNQVKLGMTRDEVISAAGTPSSTSAMENTEYLKYQLCSDWIFTDRYYVRLTDGKVDAFGRVGDFNLGY
jgi:SmpA / OmlA family